ncbi:MAG: hypothetical protein KKF74_04710 [Nanoarchaeota archaeon]|nr:hypothetical protein [Nanoarchaeota archaeon]
MTKKQKKVVINIDSETRKGRYADGFAIKIKRDLAVIDFGFDSPENQVTIVSRVIISRGLLSALQKNLTILLGNNRKNGKKKTGSEK